MKSTVSIVNSYHMALGIEIAIEEIQRLHLSHKNEEIPNKIKGIREKMEVLEKHLKTIEEEISKNGKI